MKIMRMTRMVAALLFTGIRVAARGSSPHVEFQPIHPPRQAPNSFAPGTLGRVCAIGFRNLKEYFKGGGLAFDPSLVTSHKLLYCHIHFEPTRQYFRASPEDDPIERVVYDRSSTGAIDWAGAIQRYLPAPVVSTPAARAGQFGSGTSKFCGTRGIPRRDLCTLEINPGKLWAARFEMRNTPICRGSSSVSTKPS